MSSIKDILWEDGVTTVDEYYNRLFFYGNLTKTGEGSMPLMSYMDEIGARADVMQETLANTRLFCGGGDIVIDDFGWKEGYDKEMLDYLEHGYDSFELDDE